MSRFIEWNDPLLSHLNLTVSDSPRMNGILDDITNAIEVYCARSLKEASHSEIRQMGQDGFVATSNYPITSLDRYYDSVGHVATITNDVAQIKSAVVLADSIKLTSILAGVKTTVTFLFEDYPTIGELADGIDGTGNWGCSTIGNYEDYPTTDLVKSISNLDLMIWLDGQTRSINFDSGIIYGFVNGEVRIDYTAGYNPIPADIRGVCADLATEKWNGSLSLQSESIGGYSYSRGFFPERVPIQARQILERYRRRV